ncbi:hypothetical protein ACFQ1S_14075 [Kibdelosporangium lantanae]|uniref:MarR family transcriptional regulator n=1 Tax=Kibdelosporangium lantanae TaxID=1497396 RepID=A0ABW3M8W9_9PSEU
MASRPNCANGIRIWGARTLSATDHARQEVRDALAPLIEQVDVITNRLTEAEAATVMAFLTDVTAAMRSYAVRSDVRD